MSTTETLYWDDIACVATMDVEDDPPALFFTIIEVAGYEKHSETGHYTERLYERKGGDNPFDTMSSTIGDAEVYIRGTIRWDACSHVWFGDNQGYLHVCSKEGWYSIQQVLARIWEYAKKTLPQGHSAHMFGVEYVDPDPFEL